MRFFLSVLFILPGISDANAREHGMNAVSRQQRMSIQALRINGENLSAGYGIKMERFVDVVVAV